MPAYDLTRLQSDIAQLQHENAGFGTGRLVAENLVLTAAHTLLNRGIGPGPTASSWQVRLAGDRSAWHRGFSVATTVVWRDEVRDLALSCLRIGKEVRSGPRLRLRDRRHIPGNAHPVEARGYPRASKEAEGPRDLTPHSAA